MPGESRVRFPSGDLSIELEGIFHLPDGPGPFPAAIVCHPYPPAGGSMAVPVVRTIARALAEAGIAALRFNFRSVGDSEGAFDDGRGEVEDVAGALEWLNVRPGVDPDRLALVGYSFGAAIALVQATRTDRPCPLALIGLPLTWNLPLPPADRRPWLLVAGERDQFCPLPDLHTFAQQLKDDVKVHIVAGTDHFLSGREPEVAGVVTNFLQEALLTADCYDR
jgi:alpha/beta superfamily hydrolase